MHVNLDVSKCTYYANIIVSSVRSITHICQVYRLFLTLMRKNVGMKLITEVARLHVGFRMFIEHCCTINILFKWKLAGQGH